MGFQIGLALGVIALGLWASLRLSVIGFCLFSFIIALTCLLLTIMSLGSFGPWQYFTIWMMFNVCYVVGGICLPFFGASFENPSHRRHGLFRTTKRSSPPP